MSHTGRNVFEESIEFIERCVSSGMSYQRISRFIRLQNPGVSGLSARSLLRFCSQHESCRRRRISDDDLMRVIEEQLARFRHNYGRRMMQGSIRYRLRGTGVNVSQRRIARLQRQIAPNAYHARRRDVVRQLNPIPYRAPFFGYKGHMDQNEKMEMYGCTHVAFIDGCSRYICKFITIPKKNPILIYEHLFRPVLLEFGLFDQIRIDHGSEFCLCIFVQRLLEHYRPLRAATRRSFFQTSSRTNTRAERIWPEENSRVTYHIKEVLVSMEEEEIIDMGDPATAFCVSTLTCRISAVGRENMINSWNHRRIAGPSGCMPVERMLETMNSTPLSEVVVPIVEEAVSMYERMGGQLTRSFGYGLDPLDVYEDMKTSREYIYQSHNPSGEEIYSELVHRRSDSFRRAILSYIDITSQLSATI